MCGSYQKQSLATYRVKYNTHHMQAGKMQHCQVHPKSKTNGNLPFFQ